MKIEDIAKICHEANKAYCESMEDYSQVPWEQASSLLKESVINGVKFHLANPTAKDEDSHNNWYNFRCAAGWVYGEVKSEELKTHPCMVPYDHLPIAQQSKDRLFRYIVKVFRNKV